MALVGCLDTRFYFAHAEDQASWTKKIVSEASQRGSLVASSTITIAELLSTMGADVGLETTTLRINSARLAGVNFIPLSEKIASMAGEMKFTPASLALLILRVVVSSPT